MGSAWFKSGNVKSRLDGIREAPVVIGGQLVVALSRGAVAILNMRCRSLTDSSVGLVTRALSLPGSAATDQLNSPKYFFALSPPPRLFVCPYRSWPASRRAADRYRLRMHRARTVNLTSDEIVEVRAAQRTFEGAYVRTALSQFSFALVVLKIFTHEFYSTGALFAIYGTGVLIIGLFRRQQGNRQFFSEVGEDGVHRHKFRTSGNAVVVLTALSIAAYATLIALTVRLDR
ncbi:uncharacterized protein KD926_006738 [Aspergillus affinis]|uniref:uncharacterized protein n=1 Tax=Aspergillus affinis TaxID=1070780 RepID=UPI0022FDC8CD|nr:uncharacterized protein KD926_006738 [Aspergillus affinis]KAI9041500.1 hypothetical protein KD926_006738 [Aspergillus affinis]